MPRWGLAGQDRVVGAIGRLRHEKGQDVLVRAMAGIQCIPLVLVGDGPSRADLERLAAELSIPPAPVFAGETDRPYGACRARRGDFAVKNRGPAADPRRGDGDRQTHCRVGGRGRAGGARSGECGVLVPPDNPGALRAGIQRLLDEADLAAQFGGRAQEHAKRAYAMTVIGDVIEREYRALLPEAR